MSRLSPIMQTKIFSKYVFFREQLKLKEKKKRLQLFVNTSSHLVGVGETGKELGAQRINDP